MGDPGNNVDIPKRIDRYNIVDVVGRSPSSSVYLGLDDRTDGRVIVKQIECWDNRLAVKLLRQLEVWSGLSVEGIPRLHGCGRIGADVWYAADIIDGRSIGQLFKEKRLLRGLFTESEIYRTGKHLASVLGLLHRRRVLHGNLKPSNVFLVGSLEIVLTDPGLIRTTSIEEIPSRGDMLASHRHLSPDQFLGQNPLDGRSDIYQLGLILYEMVTLVHPFDNVKTPSELKDRLTQPIALIDEIRPGTFDPSLGGAITRALSQDRENRFSSVGEFLRAWTRAGAAYDSLTEFQLVKIITQSSEIAPKSDEGVHGRPSIDQAHGPSRPHPHDPPHEPRRMDPTSWLAPLVAVVLALALIGGGGFLVYVTQTEVRLERGPTVEVGFTRQRVSYSTSRPCASRVLIEGGGARQSFSNAKQSDSRDHVVDLTGLKLGTAHRVSIESREGTIVGTTNFSTPPGTLAIGNLSLAPSAGTVHVRFRTDVKVRSMVRAKGAKRALHAPGTVDFDFSHRAVLDCPASGSLTELTIEAVDVFGVKRSVPARDVATDSIARFVRAVDALPGNLNVRGRSLSGRLDDAGISILLDGLTSLSSWLWESVDVTSIDRIALYHALNKFEGLVLSSGAPPGEIAILGRILRSPSFRGQVAPAASVANLCPALFHSRNLTPSTMLGLVGALSKWKPGRMISGKKRLCYDSKPIPDELTSDSSVTLTFLPPLPGRVGTVTLAVGLSGKLPRGLLTARVGGPLDELVLFCSDGADLDLSRETFVVRRIDGRLLGESGSSWSVRFSPAVVPAPGATIDPRAKLKLMGALLIYD